MSGVALAVSGALVPIVPRPATMSDADCYFPRCSREATGEVFRLDRIEEGPNGELVERGHVVRACRTHQKHYQKRAEWLRQLKRPTH